jgi:hypothetical protein
VANLILGDNAFPRGDWQRFLKAYGEYKIGTERYRINIDLGFGTAFTCEVNLIQPVGHGSVNMFFHKHIEYQWPPAEAACLRDEHVEIVFPAILANTRNLDQVVDAYLTTLLERGNFQFFPIWNSELKVLRKIYSLYMRLPKVSGLVDGHNSEVEANRIQGNRNPLEQALKLLVLVHVGGDVGVRKDEQFMRIMKHYFSNYSGSKVTPCFIRSQLGPVFSRLAHKLMREVLTQLEILSPNQDKARFPTVLSTFSILMMTMESLQYHFSKLPYHGHHDTPQQVNDPDHEPATRDLEEIDGADILLRFYKATACNAQLRKIGADGSLPTELIVMDADPFGVLTDIKLAVMSAKSYLEDRLHRKSVPHADLSSFFDRLLAKLYLMD